MARSRFGSMVVGGALAIVGASAVPTMAQDLTWRDVLARETGAPGHVIPYGQEELQFGELWVPDGEGPHPVVVLVHGGCWLASLPGVELMHPMAARLRQEKVAVWNVEYRRVGHPGGGYPGTFRDVARAADHLRAIAPEHDLDLDRVVAAGHSAGGHLALWLVGRSRLPEASLLSSSEPLPLRGAVSLGGIPDLEEWQRFGSRVCGEDTVAALVDAARRGDAAFADTSPPRLLPCGAPQVLVHGVFDAIAPPFLGLRYRDAARRAGDDAELVVVQDAGHFEVIAPWTPAWDPVSRAIHELLGRPEAVGRDEVATHRGSRGPASGAGSRVRRGLEPGDPSPRRRDARGRLVYSGRWTPTAPRNVCACQP